MTAAAAVSAPAPEPVTDAVVFIRLGRRCYTSAPLPLDDAIALDADLRDRIRDIGDSHLLVSFEAVGYPVLHVRARRISDVGVRDARHHVGARPRPTAGRRGTDPLGAVSVFPGARPMTYAEALAAGVVIRP